MIIVFHCRLESDGSNRSSVGSTIYHHVETMLVVRGQDCVCAREVIEKKVAEACKHADVCTCFYMENRNRLVVAACWLGSGIESVRFLYNLFEGCVYADLGWLVGSFSGTMGITVK